MHWVELQTAWVGGRVTYMWRKNTRAVGDVTVPVSWLNPSVAGAGGEKKRSHIKIRPFLGNYVT